MIIINFVLHWVDRKNLLKTASEADRVLKKFGLLFIVDFAPAYPYKTKYHHLPEQEVFTYKQSYWDIFTASQQYSVVYIEEFRHDDTTNKKEESFDNKNLCKMVVLQKRGEENYLFI